MLGGAVNALAGGGTFLVFPALILAGIAPITANATASFLLWPAGLASAWVYRNDIPSDRRMLRGADIDLASLLDSKVDPPDTPAAQALGVRQVPVLYGGRSGKLPPEGLQMGRYVQAATGQMPVALQMSDATAARPPAAVVTADSMAEASSSPAPSAVTNASTAPAVRQP